MILKKNDLAVFIPTVVFHFIILKSLKWQKNVTQNASINFTYFSYLFIFIYQKKKRKKKQYKKKYTKTPKNNNYLKNSKQTYSSTSVVQTRFQTRFQFFFFRFNKISSKRKLFLLLSSVKWQSNSLYSVRSRFLYLMAYQPSWVIKEQKEYYLSHSMAVYDGS